MLKGDRTEWAIEKAVELGVGEIVLYESDRGVTRLKEGRITSKLERFERIAEAAAKQSSRRSLAPISMHQSLRAALLNQRHGIFGDLGPTARPLRALNPLPRTCVAAGPEGGFTQEELSSLHAAQFTPISLGPLVLRAETAAITLLASMNALWGVPKS
jgi:16S rRNA (uracil1498-N3)-methyltransferase